MEHPHGQKRRQSEVSSKHLSVETADTTPGSTPPPSPGITPAGAPRSFLGTDLRVGDVASRHSDLPSCSTELPLADVAQLLLNAGCTAATVIDQTGQPVGFITEDDILQGYLQGVPWDVTVGEWLRGGGGMGQTQAPVEMDIRTKQTYSTVLPEQQLHEVFHTKSTESRDGRTWTSSHSVVSSSSGFTGGVLSHLDIARAISERPWFAESTVADFMSPLQEVPSLGPGSTMQQLLRTCLGSPERTVLRANEAGVQDMATASDLLWAFQERVNQLDDAWTRLAARPQRHRRNVSVDAPLQTAAAAMLNAIKMATDSAQMAPRGLFAVHPDTEEVLGVLTPSHFTKKSKPATPVQVKAEQSQPAAQVQVKAEEADDLPQEPQPKLQKKSPAHHLVTVGDVVAHRETAVCSSNETIADAADTLVASGRTATVVIDPDENVCGVLTENDILAALMEKIPYRSSIASWLRGGESRLPGFMVPALTLPSSTLLNEAAMEMASMAQDEGGFSTHHMLVRDENGKFRLLSALDIAKGMIDAAAAEADEWFTDDADGPDAAPASAEASLLTAAQAMKDREDVPQCSITANLREAFRTMFISNQNCVLIVSDAETAEELETEPTFIDVPMQDDKEIPGASHIVGIVTASDALRAFSERQTGEDTSLEGWLRAFTPEEHPTAQKRCISGDACLADAARVMADSNIHHLLVVEPAGTRIIGVLSALDIVCALGAVYKYDTSSPKDL